MTEKKTGLGYKSYQP